MPYILTDKVTTVCNYYYSVPVVAHPEGSTKDLYVGGFDAPTTVISNGADTFNVFEVEFVPTDWSSTKYTYTQADGWKLNTGWTEPYYKKTEFTSAKLIELVTLLVTNNVITQEQADELLG